MARYMHFEPDPNNSWEENVAAAVTQAAQAPCLLCRGPSFTVLMVMVGGEYAKLVSAPEDGRERVAFCTVCRLCLHRADCVEQAKKDILDRVSPNRN
jgi:hypothetical protein